MGGPWGTERLTHIPGAGSCQVSGMLGPWAPWPSANGTMLFPGEPSSWGPVSSDACALGLCLLCGGLTVLMVSVRFESPSVCLQMGP